MGCLYADTACYGRVHRTTILQVPVAKAASPTIGCVVLCVEMCRTADVRDDGNGDGSDDGGDGGRYGEIS